MLSIRLARFGKRNQPSYRIVVNEKQKDTYGNYLDNLGFLNYHGGKKNIELDKTKAKKWLDNGAQPSATVRNLFITEGLLSDKKSKPHGVRTKKKAKDKNTETKKADNQETNKEEKPKDEKPEQVEAKVEEKPKDDKPAPAEKAPEEKKPETPKSK